MGGPVFDPNEELIPDIKRKPGYLAKNSYEIVDHKGNVVSDSDVSPEMLKELRSGQLAIRQKPGPNNSLGLVKFRIPEPIRRVHARNAGDVALFANPARFQPWLHPRGRSPEASRMGAQRYSGMDSRENSSGQWMAMKQFA